MLIETGDDQPRTLANAFRQAVPLRGDIFKSAMEAMQAHLSNLDRAYGVHTQRQQLSVTPPALNDTPVQSLDAICAALRASIEAN
jgi:CRISPR system Cascade subunit CasC